MEVTPFLPEMGRALELRGSPILPPNYVASEDPERKPCVVLVPESYYVDCPRNE
ncbi:hypothetical protein RUM44_007229 [Polyplax serrata]|uniref:Uncharacterized protein n=1 Tax=Polyplax serrata TaxID=468196 RepID=A0ABR1B049_POLSC